MKKPIHYAKQVDGFISEVFRVIRHGNRKIINIVSFVPKIIDLAKSDDNMSSYPADQRKSRKKIFLENLSWAVRFEEINKNYYKYLFDRKENPVDQSEYMPYRIHHIHRKLKNRGIKLKTGYLSYICILRDKYIFYNFVSGLKLPTPKITAIIDNGMIRWLESGETQDINGLPQNENVDYFCKGATGEIGDSVYHITAKDGILYLNDKETSADEFKEIVKSRSVLQELIVQHSSMNRLNPGSVNSIRIGTFNNGKEVNVFNAILKLGASGQVCDNWHFGGIVVGIDLATGNLMDYGLHPTNCANKITRHPDSDVIFKGFQIPFFKEALELAKRLHSEISGVYTIGWDIAITENGPIVIEGNDNWDFRMFQVYYGGCKKRLMELFYDK